MRKALIISWQLPSQGALERFRFMESVLKLNDLEVTGLGVFDKIAVTDLNDVQLANVTAKVKDVFSYMLEVSFTTVSMKHLTKELGVE